MGIYYKYILKGQILDNFVSLLIDLNKRKENEKKELKQDKP